ncbi:MAG: DNA polymerase IV, partial [Planctomycetes bacterium]|nr:DNA polymerase IV [Planctomycetota bacterium]
HFHALATAHDLRRVVPDRDSRSIGHESTFADDLVAATDCHRVLLRHAEGVGRRLRRAKLVAKTVRLKFRYPDFETHTRQVRLEMPTQDDLVIYGEARRLFDAARPGRRPMRLLGVSAADLEAEGSCRQLGLFDDPEAAGKSQRVLETMDRIRDRFGDGAISHGGKPKPSS